MYKIQNIVTIAVAYSHFKFDVKEPSECEAYKRCVYLISGLR